MRTATVLTSREEKLFKEMERPHASETAKRYPGIPFFDAALRRLNLMIERMQDHSILTANAAHLLALNTPLGQTEADRLVFDLSESGMPRAYHKMAVIDFTSRRGTEDEEEYDYNLTPQSRMLLWTAALLHDAGKPAVKRYVMRSPNLTAQQKRKYMSHVQKTLSVIKKINGNNALKRFISNAVSEHHRRWSGGGYPVGKKGEELSLGGRVIALADAYAKKVREAGTPLTGIVSYLESDRESADKEFDPYLSERFSKMLSAASEPKREGDYYVGTALLSQEELDGLPPDYRSKLTKGYVLEKTLPREPVEEDIALEYPLVPYLDTAITATHSMAPKERLATFHAARAAHFLASKFTFKKEQAVQLLRELSNHDLEHEFKHLLRKKGAEAYALTERGRMFVWASALWSGVEKFSYGKEILDNVPWHKGLNRFFNSIISHTRGGSYENKTVFNRIIDLADEFHSAYLGKDSLSPSKDEFKKALSAGVKKKVFDPYFSREFKELLDRKLTFRRLTGRGYFERYRKAA
ncbi:HD domain-containing protein [Candidatus Micrarchaeota archaeon]|nr:HD domain-containing protein [Candidatus Micrarchaeota archaeon]